nr:MAG TPA_asm: hypothetical protein [Caudoviricetes sp.]
MSFCPLQGANTSRARCLTRIFCLSTTRYALAWLIES